MSQRTRILVIDDDPLFRSLMAALLRRDFVVFVAGEGSEGFYKALEHPPEVAVIDIQMPGWDGLKTLKAFRAHPALRGVRTMILSADASKETVLAAIEAGADDYLIKTSFSKEGFYEKLSRLLPRPEPAGAAREPKRPRALAAVGAPSGEGPVDESRLQEILDEWD